MLKVTLLYGHPADAATFEEYYKGTHLPLASKMQGVAKLELTKCLPNPDGAAASYYRMAALYFESLETMQQTFASPEGQDAVADLSKFATGGVKMVVGVVEN